MFFQPQGGDAAKMSACKRGTENPPRDRWGHCLCEPCTEFNRARWRLQNNNPSPARLTWKATNKDRMNAYSREWIKRNPEKRKAIVEDWRSRNPDKVAAMSNRAGAKWSKTNKGKRNALTRKRMAAKMRRTPAWASLSAIKAFYIEAAAISERTGIPHEVDHVIPLQGKNVSGLHVESNLQIIPRSVNRAKQNILREAV